MNRAKIFSISVGLLICIGIIFRFYQITENDFIFYDEGYYLNWSRPLGEALATHEIAGFEEFSKVVYAYVSRSLASGKALWFMLVDLRFFFGGLKQWYMSRLLAAILGVITMGLTFIFARRFFNNTYIAWFATALLAILPSHVFYSRIGLQESLSTALVLSGFYFYLFPARFNWRTLAAGTCWGLAYFSNYRLIMLPVLITFTEIFMAVSLRCWPDFRKWLWATLAFLVCVFVGGNLCNGQNTIVIFSWIFHQAQMATGQFAWFNVFSYPYYLFRLETVLFAIFFFANFYFLKRWDLKFLLPFALVLVQMAVFTLASEKGARYVGVVLPFMAMMVAYAIFEFAHLFKDKIFRGVLAVAAIVMVGMMTHKSFLLVRSHSDYRRSIADIRRIDPQSKFLSSQNHIQNLYVSVRTDVRPIPNSFEIFLKEYQSGYRYLILGPQIYVSFTESNQRFDPPLRGYIGALMAMYPPKKVYGNFSPALLERFVFEHNENLVRSITFLDHAQQRNFSYLRIYDLNDIVVPMLKSIVQVKGKKF